MSIRHGPGFGIDAWAAPEPVAAISWRDFMPGAVIHMAAPRTQRRLFHEDCEWISGSREVPWGSYLTPEADLPKIWDGLRSFRTRWQSYADGRIGTPGVYDTEVTEVLDKAVIEAGYAPRWYLIQDGADRSRERAPIAMLPSLVEWLHAGAVRELDLLRPTDLRVPIGHQNGGPTETKGLESVLVHDALANVVATSPNFRVGLEHVADTALELGNWPYHVIRQINRTGPIKKPQLLWAMEDELVARQEVLQWYPRRRAVWVVPMWLSQVFRRPATATKKAYRRWPQFNHQTDDQILRNLTMMRDRATSNWRRRGIPMNHTDWTWFELDLSGFDLSVGHADQRVLGAGIYGPLLDRLGCAFGEEMYSWLCGMPIQIGRVRPGYDMTIVSRLGTTASGFIGTTMPDGTTIATALLLTGWQRIRGGLDPTTVLREAGLLDLRDILFPWADFGDDVLMGLPNFLLREASVFEDVASEVGMKVTMKEGCLFLYRFRDLLLGTTYASGGRMLTRAFFKEHYPRTPELEILGDYQRLKYGVTHPDFAAIQEFIFSLKSGYKRYNVRDFLGLHALVTSPYFQSILRSYAGQPREDLIEFIDGIARGEEWARILAEIPWASGSMITELEGERRQVLEPWAHDHLQAQRRLHGAVRRLQSTDAWYSHPNRGEAERTFQLAIQSASFDDNGTTGPPRPWGEYGFDPTYQATTTTSGF